MFRGGSEGLLAVSGLYVFMEWVYLDLNMWIDLHMRDEDDELRKQIERSVRDGEIAIPLIHTLLLEEAGFENEELREDVFDYMYDLTNPYTLRTYIDVQKFEIERFVYGMQGHLDYELEEKVRGQGIDHLYGDWRLTLEGEELDRNGPYKEVFDELERVFKEKRGFDVTTNAVEELVRSQENWKNELHEEIEEINEEWDEIFNDNSQRRRYAKYRHFYESVFPPLIEKFIWEGQVYDFSMYDFEKYVKQGDETVESFFQLFPANYTYMELTNARDLQDGGKPNDIYDIFSLAIAIPYCDIVATEGFWKHEAENSGLDEIYGTKMVDSLGDIPESSSIIDSES